MDAKSGGVTLKVVPERALFTEPRQILCEGFAAGERVRISARLIDEADVEWSAWGEFVADRQGRVDLADAPSEAGTFTGIDPAGLFWSLRPDGSDNFDFMVKATCKPHQLGQPLFDPLRTWEVAFRAEGTSGTAEAKAELQRLVDGVEMKPLREGRLRGNLFRWKNRDRKRGAIVTLTGSGGGVEMNYAPLLASLGYDVLSLAYFNYEDLPPGVENIPLEYFEEAFQWLERELSPVAIAVQGASRGGELTLILAAYLPQYVKGAIPIVPMYASTGGWNSKPDKPTASWTFRGQEIPYAWSPDEMSLEDLETLAKTATGPIALTAENMASLDNPRSRQEAPIPAERASGPILLISGVEDAMWPSAWGSDLVLARLLEKGFRHEAEHLALRETGHITPLPNQITTFCPALYHTLLHVFLACGGNPQGSARHSWLMWDKMRAHYRQVFGH